MADWQERIDSTTAPAIRAEHEARYAVAAPLVAAGAAWCDLGCGTGLAAAAAVPDRPERLVLVDVDEASVAAAARELAAPGAVGLTADLTDPEGLAAVRAALLDGLTGPATVTCFEVVEHLSSFVPLVELLAELAGGHDVTTVLSVPNDAFWAIENPHHLARWGEGSFDELLGLLPDGAVVAHQVALQGSAVALRGGGAVTHAPPVEVRAEAVPTHFLVAIGPAAAQLAGGARLAQVDLDGQRAWERQREADAALVPRLLELVAEVDELRAKAAADSDEFAAWRSYIHELEGRLGIPPSGTPEREAYDAAQPGS